MFEFTRLQYVRWSRRNEARDVFSWFTFTFAKTARVDVTVFYKGIVNLVSVFSSGVCFDKVKQLRPCVELLKGI